MNCHQSTVERCISRFSDSADLSDLKRSGRPLVFTEDVQLKTIAFYCQVSPAPGCSTWSLRWAEQYLKTDEQIIGDSMSYSTIRRILKSHALRPHLNKYFLNITDPDFFPKMDHIIDLYLNPPDNLFCFDECTGVQAKSALTPSLPVYLGKPGYEEFEYERHGTTDLMAFLNPKTGQIFGRCNQNHNRQTLIKVFREHVATQPPDGSLHYVMDNLNTHFHDDFCRCVADLSDVPYTELKTGKERRHWLGLNSKRIVIHFTPFHGSWLNMIEIWFGILKQRCLNRQAFFSVTELEETILQFIETWNSYFSHPFKWKYTGEGLYEKTISRFNKLLVIESAQMEIKFLTKQLQLMYNISNTYNASNTKQWQQFHELLIAKKDYINKIIESDEKEKRRIKAHQALEQLYDHFSKNTELSLSLFQVA